MSATINIQSTHLYTEIHEQPGALQRLLNNEQDSIRELAAAIAAHDITHVVIAARGTSDNAARYAKYLFGAVNGLTVALATPSLFSIYEQTPRMKDALVLGISQSGQSPDIVAVLAEARQQGVLTACLTNMSDSPLAAQSDYVITLQAGLEKSVAATKTYTTELLAIALLSAHLAGNRDMLDTLERVPSLVQSTLTADGHIAGLAQRYVYMQRAVVIGRGFNYATAHEMALKLKELTYSVIEPYSSADFQHGPLAIVERRFPVIVIAPSGRLAPEMRAFISGLKERGAEVICISDDRDLCGLTPFHICTPGNVPEWASPLPLIVPGQLFAMNLAHACGYDLDTPRSIRKVTETT